MNFREMGLIDPIVKALRQEGYTVPTPIQRGAIPPALTGQDVLGCAQTGTGKTCAFATPVLQRLNETKPDCRQIRALILTPTRELAIQIGDSFKAYGRNLPLRHTVIFGGVGQQPQVDAIRKGLDILVATPGRLLDLHGQGLLDLSHVEVFVLDEADRMLDMGFIHDVRRVLKMLPQKKQTLFFSATMPPEVMDLVNGLLHNYARVEVDPVSSPVEVIRQTLYYVDKVNKTKLLAHLIETLNIPAALVFSRTKHGANRVAQDLNKVGISAAAIHGNKSQTARVQALNDFKKGNIRVLVATDIAARGIDIEELGCVFNYNLPDVPETYVHRIGRTGRAGHDGIAISFCQFDEKSELKAIEKLLGKEIAVVEGHPFPMENFDLPKKDKNGRPVNAEDAEARAAAKERRRQRDAENKARAEQRKQAKNMEETVKKAEPEARRVAAAPPAELPVEAPKKKKPKKKKKTTGNRTEGAKLPQSTAKTVENNFSTGNTVPERSSLRGARQGRLMDTMPSEPSVPTVDFVKPNPLDSDVIMDATARLLAPRKLTAAVERSVDKPKQKTPAATKTQTDVSGKKQPGRNGKKNTQANVAKASSAISEKSGEGSQSQKKGKNGKAPAPASNRKPVQAQEKKDRNVNNGSNTRKQVGARKPEPSHRSDRQKDSTQQKSLMKPYYINHED